MKAYLIIIWLQIIVFVTIYVPGVLDARLTTPVEELILNPAADVNVPATPPPLNVGDGLLPV